MTAQEAIRELKKRVDLGEREYMQDIPEYVEALKMAINALKNERDLRNELCLVCGKFRNAHKGACKDCRWEEA